MCGCQEKLESKWMPKSLIESTRSMWPVVVLMSGRFAVMEGGPMIISLVSL